MKDIKANFLRAIYTKFLIVDHRSLPINSCKSLPIAFYQSDRLPIKMFWKFLLNQKEIGPEEEPDLSISINQLKTASHYCTVDFSHVFRFHLMAGGF